MHGSSRCCLQYWLHRLRCRTWDLQVSRGKCGGYFSCFHIITEE